MSKPLSPSRAIRQLRECSYHFDENSANSKLDLLNSLSNSKHLTPAQIKQLHAILLFLMAYPDNEPLYLKTKSALDELHKLIQKLSLKERVALEQSTLPYTLTRGFYSFSLVHWIRNQNEGEVGLDELEEGALHPREVLKHCLAEMEYDLHGNEAMKPLEWLHYACGSKDPKSILEFIITQIDHLQVPMLIKDQLFESIRVGIQFKSENPGISSSQLTLAGGEVFFHNKGILKNFDEKALILSPLPKEKYLDSVGTRSLIRQARYYLFLLNRETDPISLCDEQGIEFYELERGFSIAFFSKTAERRLPLESYIGFMMFKNKAPIAYGGGWLFGKRSLLGINIFESYRGGESSYLFCQLLRSYTQRFRLSYIEVEPYQFGRGNPEGIKSGAFWFYYRFGFRPVDPDIEKLAAEEHFRIRTTKGYRSSYSTLKMFTQSNLVLTLDPSFKTLDPSIISHFITLQINLKFGGNRAVFRAWSIAKIKKELGLEISKLNKAERIGLEKLHAFVSLCLATDKLKSTEKNKVVELIKEKGKSEFRYAVLLEKFDLIRHIGSEELRTELGI